MASSNEASSRPPGHPQFGMISMTTIETMMGEKRFRRLMTFIKRKYKTKRVVLGYHHKGKGAEVVTLDTAKNDAATEDNAAPKAANGGV